MESDEVSTELDRVRSLTDQIGLEYVDLDPAASFGQGIGIAFAHDKFTVLSIGSATPSILYVTSGIVRNMENQDRLGPLEACNLTNTQGNGFTCIFHDAENGWDSILQMQLPSQVFIDIPRFTANCVQIIADLAVEERAAHLAAVGGRPYMWNEEDAQRLLWKSLA
jgi:hypothetical protein